MPRDRTPRVRAGKVGHPKGFCPARPDAQSLLLELAEKGRAPSTTGKRRSRNKGGQTVNYAGFGDQYFRLTMNLMPATSIMVVGEGGSLEYLNDKQGLELHREATNLLAQHEDVEPSGGRFPDGRGRHRKAPKPERKFGRKQAAYVKRRGDLYR